MNWKREAECDLKNYTSRLTAIENLISRIRVLEEKYTSLRGISMDTPVMGGASHQEDSMINNIVEREKLRNNLKTVRMLVKLTEKGLAGLDERQRDILNAFYINRTENHVETLSAKYHLEKSRLYQLKDEALYKFTISMFGIIDL